MRKLLIPLLLILSFFSAQGFAGSCPDGSEPAKSISADGTYFVYNCGGSNTANSSTSSQKVAKALAGINIENDPNLDFFSLPLGLYPTNKTLHGSEGRIADFNNDGLSDVIYIGMMDMNASPSCTYSDCSYSQIDDNDKPLPALYLGNADGKLHYSPELFIDNRSNKGMSLGRRLLIADFNNDKLLDIYINDTSVSGPEKWGYRDSYFLSQPNGTWLESSKTHLSQPNFRVYDHGGATGDIDNDGDMDIVITELHPQFNNGFYCLMNNGSGFLKMRKCGGTSSASSVELSDIDNDGDLDAIVGGMNRNQFTGIVWNDGSGNFLSYMASPLNDHNDVFHGIPDVTASDLDNDGDMDIVFSKVGTQIFNSKADYKGSAIQFIENLGSKKFREYDPIPIVKDSRIGWIKNILFRDLDNDGDIDLYLNSMDQSTNGSVFVNNGDFNFSLIMPPEAYKLYGSLAQNGIIESLVDREEKVSQLAELKKKQEEEKAKRLAKDRENKKNNFKYSSRNFKSQLKLLQTQGNLAVCKAILKEFHAGDYYSQTNKETYLFISIDSNGLDCHYEWSRNENNALRRCKQNNKTDGKCTIYALGDNIVWGDPELYKELTGRK
ncbi:FG-GAP repeat domain-containing protein [Pseudothioglobus sp. nBUS_23]|uniref:FG-GAP repeat domain-containing protein n=1 Tax=Pseudothioglobus sp. nBUS_23 TaxID=3395318 RepID=UPI003EC14527